MDDPSMSSMEKAKLCKSAINHQNRYKLDAMNGEACDRHIFGLYIAAKMAGICPKIFTNKVTPWRDRLKQNFRRAKLTRLFLPVLTSTWSIVHVTIAVRIRFKDNKEGDVISNRRSVRTSKTRRIWSLLPLFSRQREWVVDEITYQNRDPVFFFRFPVTYPRPLGQLPRQYTPTNTPPTDTYPQ